MKAGKRSDWIIDSGASCHMTWEKELFHEYKALSGSTVKLGDGRTVEAMGEGTVKVSVYRGDGKLHTLSMKNVLHVPELSCDRSQTADSLSYSKTIDVRLSQLGV